MTDHIHNIMIVRALWLFVSNALAISRKIAIVYLTISELYIYIYLEL